jgi:hypothetical protein
MYKATNSNTYLPQQGEQYQKPKIDLYTVAYKRNDPDYDELLEALQRKVKSLKALLDTAQTKNPLSH